MSEELAVFNTELEIGLNKISTERSSADCQDNKGLIEKLWNYMGFSWYNETAKSLCLPTLYSSPKTTQTQAFFLGKRHHSKSKHHLQCPKKSTRKAKEVKFKFWSSSPSQHERDKTLEWGQQQQRMG